MLESLHVRRDICAQIRSGPLGAWLDPFVATLKEHGHTSSVMRRYVHAAATFAAWLSRHRIAAADIDEAVVLRATSRLSRWRDPSRSRGRVNTTASGIRALATFLWSHGVADRGVGSPENDIERWLQAFHDHLTRVRGTAPGTCRIYLRYARSLLTECWPTACSDWAALSAERILNFVRVQTEKLDRSANRGPGTATRSFLRFLIADGVVRPGLDGAVPTIRQWKLASLPRTIAAADVERVLTALDDARPTGVRDRAIVLLLSRLGLRAGEVAALRTTHIEWRDGRVHVPPGKTGRARVLPLPQDVGAAVVQVLRTRPPQAPRDAIFVRARAPYRPMTASAITSLAQRALRRASVQVNRPGAHAFRHTVATQLVQQGVSMKTVADVLGHTRLETTAIYAKLDVHTLATVALPWPGGEQ